MPKKIDKTTFAAFFERKTRVINKEYFPDRSQGAFVLETPSEKPNTLSFLKNRRLVVVSNREPYTLQKIKSGWKYQRTIGGLVTALDPVLRSTGGVWVCWSHSKTFPFSGGGVDILEEAEGKPPYRLQAVPLTEEEVEHYYFSYSNRQLWPLLHSFIDRCNFDETDWPFYQRVNRKFAEATAKIIQPSDVVWIHDYQLTLVPDFLRELSPKQTIGFFCHIPFPHYDHFRALPQRAEVLRGMLGADVIGFHSPVYVQNFLESVKVLLPGKIRVTGNKIQIGQRYCRVISCPIGIDFHFYKSLAESRETEERVRQMRQEISTSTIGLGVDRLDHTKGILHRLLAIERLLEKYPEYHRNLTFIQIVVPSRTQIPEYQAIKDQIELTVGRINGCFSDGSWVPVRYYYRGFSPQELAAYYRMADFCLVSPLRDGMNLVAKEYPACCTHNEGALILSEFTGAAQQLRDAYVVNPYHTQEVADAIHRALTLPREEAQHRMRQLRQQVHRQDIHWWVRTFLKELV